MKKTVIIGALVSSLFLGKETFAASYTVQPGDSLWKIATTNQTTVDSLMSLNQLTNTNIYAGQTLELSETSPTNNTRTYQIKSGEYLSIIAKKYNISLTQLLALNPDIDNPSLVKIGQVINVPNTNTNTNTINNQSPNTAPYQIKSGEYLTIIAKRYGITLTQLLILNPDIKEPNAVKAGQLIFVPSGNVPKTEAPIINWETTANAVIKSGEKYIGAPYVFGASTNRTDIFDCSSFTMKVYSENGISLPRTSLQQSQVGKEISLSEARKGDLLFFDTDGDGVINHVSIFTDVNTVLHASTSNGVTYSNTQYYWMPRFVKAMRVIQ